MKKTRSTQTRDDRIYLRVNSDEKQAADRLAKSRGTNISAMVRAYVARAAARQLAKEAK